MPGRSVVQVEVLHSHSGKTVALVMYRTNQGKMTVTCTKSLTSQQEGNLGQRFGACSRGTFRPRLSSRGGWLWERYGKG